MPKSPQLACRSKGAPFHESSPHGPSWRVLYFPWEQLSSWVKCEGIQHDEDQPVVRGRGLGGLMPSS